MKKPPPIIHENLVSGTLIGDDKYRLVEKLASGGNGVVWLAEHLALGQQVVAKFPIRGSGNQSDQLETEMKLLAQFSNRHPNIVNILDVGIHKGKAFIVVQYLTNGTLTEYLFGRTRPRALAGKCLHLDGQWTLAIAGALDFLHNNELLHLDIKPANILFDSSFSPYLSDFGIATDQSAGSGDGNVYGTLPYVAPEVLIGNPVPQSDQFSFAVTLWEFLTGKRPFGNESPKDNLKGWKKIPLPPGCRRAAGPDLNAAFQKALSFEPLNRFEDCKAFANELIRLWPFDQAEWERLLENSALPADSNPSKRITRSVGHSEDETKTKSGIPIPKSDSSKSTETENKKSVRLSRIMRRDSKKQ